MEAALASYPGPGRYNVEGHLGESFRVSKVGAAAVGAWEGGWVAPPSIGAGVEGASGENRPPGREGGDGLPKRHARFMERFRAAKESRAEESRGGVTSFGALLPDSIGRAD